jgi:hypothetical protein
LGKGGLEAGGDPRGGMDEGMDLFENQDAATAGDGPGFGVGGEYAVSGSRLSLTIIVAWCQSNSRESEGKGNESLSNNDNKRFLIATDTLKSALDAAEKDIAVMGRLQSVDVVEVLAGLLDTLSHGEFGLSNPTKKRKNVSSNCYREPIRRKSIAPDSGCDDITGRYRPRPVSTAMQGFGI